MSGLKTLPMKKKKTAQIVKATKWDKESTWAIIKLGFGILCLYLIITFITETNNKSSNLDEVTIGTVTSIIDKGMTTQGRTGAHEYTMHHIVDFTYTVNDKKYTNVYKIPSGSRYAKFINKMYDAESQKKVKIMYNSHDPQDSQIIIE